jgi:hypothetical protein
MDSSPVGTTSPQVHAYRWISVRVDPRSAVPHAATITAAAAAAYQRISADRVMALPLLP